MRPILSVVSGLVGVITWLGALPARGSSMERAAPSAGHVDRAGRADRADRAGPVDRAESPGVLPTAEEQRIFALVNQERARLGCPPLVWDDALARVARAHSADMRARRCLDHRSASSGATPIDRARAAGLRPGLMLENIGYAYSPEQANLAFLMSAGHRRNVLDPDVRKLGVGVVVRVLPDGDRQLWITEDFARDLPPLDDAMPGHARSRVLARYAGRAVSEDPLLSHMAATMAALVAAGGRPGDLPETAVRGPMGRQILHNTLQVITVRTADPDHLGDLPPAADGMATTYGIGVALEPDDGRAERNVCIVLLLGGR